MDPANLTEPNSVSAFPLLERFSAHRRTHPGGAAWIRY
jgi:hypothetical protein